MFRSRYSTLFVLSMVVCGLAIAFAGHVRSQPAKTAEKGGPLKEWEFPDAEHLRGGNVGDVFASDYATSKPFEEVWTYYAKKVGYKKAYQPNLTHGRSTFSSDGAQYQIQILNSTNDPAVAKARRPSGKSATLMRRGAGGNVTVFISRAKDEEKTYFTLIVEGK